MCDLSVSQREAEAQQKALEQKELDNKTIDRLTRELQESFEQKRQQTQVGWASTCVLSTSSDVHDAAAR